MNTSAGRGWGLAAGAARLLRWRRDQNGLRNRRRGLIGGATARALGRAGFDVTAVARGLGSTPPIPALPGVRAIGLDRTDDRGMQEAFGDGCDVLIDVIPYRPEDAEQVISLATGAGAVVAISSAAVYAAKDGATLLSRPEAVPDRALAEDDPIVPANPDPDDYAGVKVYIEQRLQERISAPVTVIRPGAVYGPHDTASREWYFVKRVLDRRTDVVLAHRGASIFHHAAAANVGRLVCLAAQQPRSLVVNAGDQEPLSVLEIGRAVAGELEHEWNEVLLNGPPSGPVGRTPWTTAKPFVLDMTKASSELDYSDAVSYEEALRATCAWLTDVATGDDWASVRPRAATFYSELFDYEAEDSFLAQK